MKKFITLLKSCKFDCNDYRQFLDTFFVNFDLCKQVKIDFGTKNVSLTELRTIVLNKLGLKNSSSFVLSFRGKTLPLGNTLISDPSIGLVSYDTLTVVREHLNGGGTVFSVCNIEYDTSIPANRIAASAVVSASDEEDKVDELEPARHQPE